MAAVLLSCGTPGKRYSLPHSRILIHHPSMSGLAGQAADAFGRSLAAPRGHGDRNRDRADRIWCLAQEGEREASADRRHLVAALKKARKAPQYSKR